MDGRGWKYQELRRQLDKIMKDPQFDIHNKVNPVVSALVELLQANGKDMAAICGN